MQKKHGVFHSGFRTEGPKHRTAAKCVKAPCVSHGRAISRTTFRLEGHGVKGYGGPTLCVLLWWLCRAHIYMKYGLV